MRLRSISIYIMFFFSSCTLNPLHGKWKRNDAAEELVITDHYYTSKRYQSAADSMVIVKKGKIIFRNDSIQFIPAQIYFTNEQRWVFDYSKERPVFLTKLFNDTLWLIHSSDTVIYFRDATQ